SRASHHPPTPPVRASTPRHGSTRITIFGSMDLAPAGMFGPISGNILPASINGPGSAAPPPPERSPPMEQKESPRPPTIQAPVTPAPPFIPPMANSGSSAVKAIPASMEHPVN